MDYNRVVAANIRKCRKTAGLTQTELAEEVGMCAQHLSRIERCVSSPTVNTLVKIAECLDIKPARLFDECDIETFMYLYF